MRLASFLLAATLAGLGSVHAESPETKLKAEVRALVKTQVKALRRNDAAGFAQTISTGIRSQFTDVDTLLGVLSSKTPELADAEIVGFGPLKATAHGLTQMVRLSDRAGHPWLAFFIVERDASGKLAVKNLIAAKMPGQVV